MSISKSNFRVLIMGGGNCGLAIATGLKKAGISYTVFERDNEHDFAHKALDWGMLLHWGTEYFQEVLPQHLQERMKEPRVDPSHGEMVEPIPYMDGATGEVLSTVPTNVINRVSRKKLRKFLTEGENLDVKCNKKLESINIQGGSVTVRFEDGSQETGGMVIGCDGSHSKIREFLVGAEAAELEDTGHTMVNYAAANYTPEQAHLLREYHPIVKLCWHPTLPGGALLAALDIPDPNDTTDWKFQTYTSWSGPPHAEDLKDPQVRMKWLRERMAQFCEPFRTAFMAVDESEVMPVFPGHQWAPTMKWDNHGGKVTIAGDAAHSMLPHRGQGLNNALKDASDIVDAVKAAVSGTQTLSEGITAYEEEMRHRGAKEVALSFEQAQKSSSKDLNNSPMFKYGHEKSDAIHETSEG